MIIKTKNLFEFNKLFTTIVTIYVASMISYHYDVLNKEGGWSLLTIFIMIFFILATILDNENPSVRITK